MHLWPTCCSTRYMSRGAWNMGYKLISVLCGMNVKMHWNCGYRRTHTVAVPSTAIKQKHIYYDDRRLASNKIVAFRYRHKRNNPFYWKQNRQLCRTIINKYCLPIKRNLTARAVNGWFYVVHVCVRARVSCATRFIPTVSRIRLLYRFVPCTYKRRKTWIEQT